MTENLWPLWSAEHPTPPPPEVAVPRCPGCGADVSAGAAFCEACGGPLQPTAVAPAPAGAVTGSSQTRRLGERVSALTACPACGGNVAADGYCQTCGAKAPSARDHFSQAPAPWVGGVCDRGVQHHRNEDALALWAQDDRAVLVVCDGVSTSVDSDVASLAAAAAAVAALIPAATAVATATETGDAAAADSLIAAAAAANEAVIATTVAATGNAASATFAAAIVAGDRVHFASLGDSRVYYLGETRSLLLSVDDSMAQAFIDEGMPRVEAESMPRAHAITKWLGRDAVDIVPRTGVLSPTEPGWLLVCSDGLWNYASEPAALHAQLDALAGGSNDPSVLAAGLVAWANAQGGRDNVTVALARCTPAAMASLGNTPNDRTGKEQPADG